MSTATASRRYLVAQAAIRSDAIMHLTSERDSGALNPVCGAHPVRSSKINLWPSPDGPAQPADLRAFCADCADFLLHVPGIDSIEQGIAAMTEAGSTAARTRLLELPLDSIDFDEARARRDGGDIEALALSIADAGVLQPISVRETNAGYELVMGLRRLAAARMAGLTAIPALVRVLDDERAIIAALAENHHRADLNPIDQAHAFQHALSTLGLKQQELAARARISQPHISNTLRLLTLPTEVQELVLDGALGAAHAREVLKVDGEAAQVAFARGIAAQGLSVKETAARRQQVSPAPPRADLSQLLKDFRDASMVVTPRPRGRARVTIDVLEADLERLVAGIEALAVA